MHILEETIAEWLTTMARFWIMPKCFSTPLGMDAEGNGGGPTFWWLISLSLLQAQQADGFGTNFWWPISESWVIFVTYAFFNNTDLIETAKFPSDNIEDMV